MCFLFPTGAGFAINRPAPGKGVTCAEAVARAAKEPLLVHLPLMDLTVNEANDIADAAHKLTQLLSSLASGAGEIDSVAAALDEYLASTLKFMQRIRDRHVIGLVALAQKGNGSLSPRILLRTLMTAQSRPIEGTGLRTNEETSIDIPVVDNYTKWIETLLAQTMLIENYFIQHSNRCPERRVLNLADKFRKLMSMHLELEGVEMQEVSWGDAQTGADICLELTELNNSLLAAALEPLRGRLQSPVDSSKIRFLYNPAYALRNKISSSLHPNNSLFVSTDALARMQITDLDSRVVLSQLHSPSSFLLDRFPTHALISTPDTHYSVREVVSVFHLASLVLENDVLQNKVKALESLKKLSLFLHRRTALMNLTQFAAAVHSIYNELIKTIEAKADLTLVRKVTDPRASVRLHFAPGLLEIALTRIDSAYTLSDLSVWEVSVETSHGNFTIPFIEDSKKPSSIVRIIQHLVDGPLKEARDGMVAFFDPDAPGYLHHLLGHLSSHLRGIGFLVDSLGHMTQQLQKLGVDKSSFNEIDVTAKRTLRRVKKIRNVDFGASHVLLNAALASLVFNELEAEPNNALELRVEQLKDQRERRLRAGVVRRGSTDFRVRVQKAYGNACALTKSRIADTLTAAHVVRYWGTETNVTSNGILMRQDLHTLYDRQLMTIDAETLEIRLAKRLREGAMHAEADGHIMALHGKKMQAPANESDAPDRNALLMNQVAFELTEYFFEYNTLPKPKSALGQRLSRVLALNSDLFVYLLHHASVVLALTDSEFLLGK